MDKGLADAVAGLVDPVPGHLALGVGGLGQGDQLGAAAVPRLVPGAVQGHHLVGLAGHSGFHGGLSGGIGLTDVGLGGQVGPAPLEEGELNAPDLHPQGLLHPVGQQGGQATQLGMAEAVGGGGFGLRDKGAVGVVDALGDGHQAVAGLLVDLLHIGQELVHVKVHLWQVHQVRPGASPGGQASGPGQPAGMAAHDLHDDHGAGVIDPGVLVQLHAGGGDVLGGAAVAGAVVRAGQVVVDGLGHPDDVAGVAHLLHVLADLVAGVHGVVAAVVEEVAHVVLLEDLQDAAVVGVVLVRVGQLIPAGAQGGGGGVLEQIQLGRVLLAHVVQFVSQHPFDAVGSPQNPGDLGGGQGGLDDPLGTGIDDRSGPAGLADDAGAFQLFHGKKPPLVWLGLML